jgi:hypothetical protein
MLKRVLKKKEGRRERKRKEERKKDLNFTTNGRVYSPMQSQKSMAHTYPTLSHQTHS